MEHDGALAQSGAIACAALPGGLHLRQADGTDEPVLRDLFLASRPDAERALLATHPLGDVLLNMQWQARQMSYAAQFPRRVVWLVQTGSGDTIGSLVVCRSASDVRLIDIVLRQTVRGQGLGTQLLHWLQAGAARDNLPLRLSVAADSPARRLYERVGFRAVAATETDTEMEWLSPS